MNIRTAVRRIKTFKPETPEEFADAGVPVLDDKNFVYAGVFREVYRIVGVPLVVKFPLGDSRKETGEGRRHTNAEVNRIKRLSAFPVMRKYLPKVYYHDKASGIVVMRYYAELDEKWTDDTMVNKFIQDLVKDITGIQLSDVHDGNIRSSNGKPTGRPVMIDCGY